MRSRGTRLDPWAQWPHPCLGGTQPARSIGGSEEPHFVGDRQPLRGPAAILFISRDIKKSFGGRVVRDGWRLKASLSREILLVALGNCRNKASLNRPRKRKRTNRGNPRTIPEQVGKSRKNRESPKKDKKGRTSPDRETPPFETPPFGGPWLFRACLRGYRTIIARYVAKWGIAQMCLCE